MISMKTVRAGLPSFARAAPESRANSGPSSRHLSPDARDGRAEGEGALHFGAVLPLAVLHALGGEGHGVGLAGSRARNSLASRVCACRRGIERPRSVNATPNRTNPRVLDTATSFNKPRTNGGSLGTRQGSVPRTAIPRPAQNVRGWSGAMSRTTREYNVSRLIRVG